MTESEDLLGVESHFGFGENWASYSRLIGETEILESMRALQRLLRDSVRGSRFLDIGCGSGLHALAASRLGASEIVCIDIDPKSVETTRRVLAANGVAARVEQRSVFELRSSNVGRFDITYSWGVLHHTGNMIRALQDSAATVEPGGLLCVALYGKTWLCPLWRWEKRQYKQWSKASQSRAQSLYKQLFALGKAMKGVRFREFVKSYRERGMDFDHDVHDWLGGYPYESILPEELDALMNNLRFESVRNFVRRGKVFGRPLGLFGSGCHEFVYRLNAR